LRRRAFVALTLAALALAGAAHGQPLIWTVRGSRGSVVLFGSVHILPRGLDWRPAALDEALSRAGDIWFELPINQATSQAAVRMIVRRGSLPAGDTLWRRLTDQERARIEAAARAVGVPIETLGAMRPWLADLTLSQAADARLGALAVDGVETRLQNDAPPGARRHAFETARQQVELLAAGSPAEQLASLDETAREVTDDPDIYSRSVGEWMAGDLDGLRRDDLDIQKSVAPAAYRRLVVERNLRWARTIAGLARGPGVTVVVVGAGHLIGPDGLPALLRARGLAVDGP
jgi:uncharacterized protein YbaP (TraB family)